MSELVIYAVSGPGKQPIAEPPPAASPQLGRWICHQGLQYARMRCVLLVLAAARVLLLLLLWTTAAFAFLRLATFVLVG